MSDRQEPRYSTRRELAGATLVTAAAALVLGFLWLGSRGAPSATRDPAMITPRLVPTPTPTPLPVATPPATPQLRARRERRRRRRRPVNF